MYRRYDSNPIFGFLHPHFTGDILPIIKPGAIAAHDSARILQNIYANEKYSVLAATPIDQLSLSWMVSVGAVFYDENPTILFFIIVGAFPTICCLTVT
ncbi:MAG: hypothetical protein AAF787_23605, partial [Chloroflexota bacterium]